MIRSRPHGRVVYGDPIEAPGHSLAHTNRVRHDAVYRPSPQMIRALTSNDTGTSYCARSMLVWLGRPWVLHDRTVMLTHCCRPAYNSVRHFSSSCVQGLSDSTAIISRLPSSISGPDVLHLVGCNLFIERFESPPGFPVLWAYGWQQWSCCQATIPK